MEWWAIECLTTCDIHSPFEDTDVFSANLSVSGRLECRICELIQTSARILTSQQIHQIDRINIGASEQPALFEGDFAGFHVAESIKSVGFDQQQTFVT